MKDWRERHMPEEMAINWYFMQSPASHVKTFLSYWTPKTALIGTNINAENGTFLKMSQTIRKEGTVGLRN